MALRDRARQWLDGMPWRAQRQRAEPVGPRLLVMGVGGAGGNAVNNMIEGGLSGVAFCAVNTDLQALEQSLARRRLQIGPRVTRGLGAGARVEMGRMAAEESIDEIKGQLKGVDVVFITAGMGGGTGTGAAPVIARVARHLGILTVAVVTKPFRFEGDHRLRLAEGGIEEMQLVADTLVVIPNENLFGVSDAQTTFAEAFRIADNVLHAAVRGISDLMVKPGLVNLDFADIRTVMTEMGQAMTATGAASGENRAIAAAEAAISNPLIEDCSMRGARSVLVNVIGGPDLTLFEVNEAVSRIRAEADRDANIIFGSSFEKKLAGTILINVVATGIGPEGRGGEWQVRRIEERGEAASGDAATMEPPASEIAGEPQPDRHDAAGVSTKAKAAVLGIAAVCLIGAVGFALLSGAGSEAPAPAPQADAAASAPDLVADAAPPPAAQDGLEVVAEVAAEPPSSGSSMPVNSGELGVVVEPPVAEVLPTALPAPTVAKATPPAERHARSGYRLQLGAFRSETAAQAEVRRIQRVHGAILDRSEGTAKRIEIADRGSLWRVRIGPIAERSTAERLCDALKRHQTDCLLVETASAAPAVR